MGKRIAALIISIVILITNSSIIRAAETGEVIYTDGGFTYSVEADGTAKLVKYIGTEADVIIPSTIGNGITVTELGAELFSNNQVVETVFIPENIVKIEFYFISTNTFYGALNLRSIDVAEGNPVFSSDEGVLYRYDGTGELSLTKYPEAKTNTSYVIPYGTEAITPEAFICNSYFGNSLYLKKLIVPSTVACIGSLGAFTSMTVDILLLHNKAEQLSIGTNAFCLRPESHIIVKNSSIEKMFQGQIEYIDPNYADGVSIINLETASPEVKAQYEVPATSLTYDDGTTEGTLTLDPGQKGSLKNIFKILPADTTNTVTWTSSDPAIAKVNAINGNLEASGGTTNYPLKTGTCIVTGTTENGLQIKLYVTVYKAVESMEWFGGNQADVTVENGSSPVTISLNIKPYLANNRKNVVWSSSDSSIASVVHDGEDRYGYLDATMTILDVGTTTITATLDDNGKIWTKSFQLTVTEKRIPISECTIADIPAESYTGEAVEPDLEIMNGSTQLFAGIDYDVTYKNNINTGMATVTIAGKGKYSGTAYKSFFILTHTVVTPAPVSPVPPTPTIPVIPEIPTVTEPVPQTPAPTVAVIEPVVNTSRVQTLTVRGKKLSDKTVTMTYGTTTSIKGAAKTSISYLSSNQKIVRVTGMGKIIPTGTGIATITVTAVNGAAYDSVSEKITVIVEPKKSVIQAAASKKKAQLTVSWKKDNKVSGYQIQYSKKSSFKSAKSITTGMRKTSQTIKKLSTKTKYYVRVRAYKTVRLNGKSVKQYGAWSVTKKAVVK